MNEDSWWKNPKIVVPVTIFIVAVGLFLLLPNKAAMFEDLSHGTKVSASWTLGALLTVLVLGGPFILGFVARAVGMYSLEQLLFKEEGMSGVYRYSIIFSLSLIIAMVWIILLPIVMINSQVYDMFVDWGWRTSWEVVPWGWAGYAMICFMASYALASLLAWLGTLDD